MAALAETGPEDDPVYRTRYDALESSSVVVSVAEAVAAARGVAPADAEFKLRDHVETDALDGLFGHRGEWELAFDVEDHTVTVDSDGLITVRRR